MTEVYLTVHALTLPLEIIVFFIFYPSLQSLLALGYNIIIDNRVGDIV